MEDTDVPTETVDHDVKPRKMLSVLRQPGRPTSWGATLSTWQLLLALIIGLAAVWGVVDRTVSFLAKPKVNEWTTEQIAPLREELRTLPTRFATRPEFEAHVTGENLANDELKELLKRMDDRVEYLYRNEIRKAREGSAPSGGGGGGK